MKQDTGYTHGGDIYRNDVRLDFSANVNPYGTPEAVKAAVRAASENMAIYPDPYCTELRNMLARKHGVSSRDIICGNGAAELIFQFVTALMPQLTLLPVPSFSEYENALYTVRSDIRYHFMKRENDFLLDSSLLSEISAATDLVMLCNPNNPTGRSIDRELLLRILDRCRETGTWLFADECFYDLTDSDKAFSLADYLREGDRVFLLHAFTKTYGMAGARLGYGLCMERELLDRMCAHSQAWNVSNLAQAAGVAALSCTDWAKAARELFATEKDYIMKCLRDMGLKAIRGDANFCMFSASPLLYTRLIGRGILIRDCSNYEGLCEGDYRIAVRTHEENEELMRAIAEVIE